MYHLMFGRYLSVPSSMGDWFHGILGYAVNGKIRLAPYKPLYDGQTEYRCTKILLSVNLFILMPVPWNFLMRVATEVSISHIHILPLCIASLLLFHSLILRYSNTMSSYFMGTFLLNLQYLPYSFMLSHSLPVATPSQKLYNSIPLLLSMPNLSHKLTLLLLSILFIPQALLKKQMPQALLK